jgi:Ty3 transposon capsid-like protein
MSSSNTERHSENTDSIKISQADFISLTSMANSYNALQARLEALEASITPRIHIPFQASQREPRISDPEHFDGKRSQVRNFLSQVRLVINAQPSRFVTERQKVMFAASFLRSTAFSWFQPFLDSPNGSGILEDFSMFALELQNTFGDPDQVGSAERQLFALRQVASVASYAADFRRISSTTTWNDSALNAQFYRGLKDSVKDELAKMDKPETLDAMIEISVRLDNRLHERRMERGITTYVQTKPIKYNIPLRSHNNQVMPFSETSTTSYPSNYTGPQPMEIAGNVQRFKTLTPEEKSRRKKENLCLYCGKPGHVANTCPARPNTSSYQNSRLVSKINANRTISNLVYSPEFLPNTSQQQGKE